MKKSMDNRGDTAWNTFDELNFLAKVGRQIHTRNVLTARPVLLRRYADTCEIRKRWGKIDKEIVLDYVRGELGG